MRVPSHAHVLDERILKIIRRFNEFKSANKAASEAEKYAMVPATEPRTGSKEDMPGDGGYGYDYSTVPPSSRLYDSVQDRLDNFDEHAGRTLRLAFTETITSGGHAHRGIPGDGPVLSGDMIVLSNDAGGNATLSGHVSDGEIHAWGNPMRQQFFCDFEIDDDFERYFAKRDNNPSTTAYIEPCLGNNALKMTSGVWVQLLAGGDDCWLDYITISSISGFQAGSPIERLPSIPDTKTRI